MAGGYPNCCCDDSGGGALTPAAFEAGETGAMRGSYGAEEGGRS